MADPLVGLHAFLGELGIAAFLWAFIETLNPERHRIKRARIAALLGVIFLFASWIVGGYYYVNYYGINVKPLIKGGPEIWGHDIFMESKEHIFLFLPFLALLTFSLINNYERFTDKNKKIRKSVLWLCILIIILGAMMAFMGYLISSSVRAALEAAG